MCAASTPRPSPDREPVSLQGYAEDHLVYIRRTMERAGAFTAVSGKGQIAVGIIGVLAAVAASRAQPAAWLMIWLAAAVVSSAVAVAAMVHKARRLGVPLLSGPGRKFALGFLPPLAAGAILTVAVYYVREPGLLPGLWLLLFGAAVLGAGALSVPPVPVMGGCFMALGVVALAAPPEWANWLLGLGFGAVHIFFGILITVKHGG